MFGVTEMAFYLTAHPSVNFKYYRILLLLMRANKLLIFAIAALALLISSCSSGASSQQLDTLAKCLGENNVIMYGAYWCPHCTNQKEMFGDSFQYITYIECSLPNKAGRTQQCTDAGIKAYPTWEFKDGTRIEGEMTVHQLSKKTGCRLE